MVRTRSRANQDKRPAEQSRVEQPTETHTGTKAARRTRGVKPSTKPTRAEIHAPMRQLTTDAPNMAQAEEVRSDGFVQQFAQMTKAMDTLNITLVEMSKGLSTRLDNLSERMDVADNSNKQMYAHAEEDRKLTNQKLGKLEKLLTQSDVNSKLIYKKLKVTEARLIASETTKAQLMERINYLENRSRICNILVDGHPESADENLRVYILDLVNFLTNNMFDAKELVAIFRVGKNLTVQDGKQYRTQRPRSIKVIFDKQLTRNQVYYARAALKGSQMYKGIFIGDDVTLETKKAREAYRSVAALARTQKVEVRMHDDGIILAGRKYKLFEHDSLPDKLSLKKAKMIEVNGAIYFHSEYAFLSNFFYSPILLDDTVFLSAEHRFQYEKCVTVNNLNIAARVIAAPTALEAKRLGDTVKETPEWRLARDQILEDTLIIKFAQHKDLAQELMQTGQKKLYEATVNPYYGIGANLHSREVRDGTHKGENKLGQALERIRSQLAEKKEQE